MSTTENIYVPRVAQLDVRNKGAVSGASDVTSLIQSALNAGTQIPVVIPAGTWNLSQITIPSGGKLIISQGAVINSLVNTSVPLITNAGGSGGSDSNVTVIHDGVINCQGGNQGTGSAHGIHFHTVSKPTIKGRGLVDNAKNHCVRLDNCTDIAVEGLELTGALTNGGLMVANCSRGSVDSVHSHDHDSTVGSPALYGAFFNTGTNGINVRNLTIDNTTDDCMAVIGCDQMQFSQIRLTNAGDGGCHCGNSRDVWFTDIHSEGHDGLGLSINPNGGTSERIHVKDARVKDCGGLGINYQSSYGSILGAVITGTTVAGVYTGSGLEIRGQSPATYDDNYIAGVTSNNNAWRGIELISGANRNTVIGCTVRNNAQHGINDSGSNAGNFILYNKAFGNGATPQFLENSVGGVHVGNTVTAS